MHASCVSLRHCLSKQEETCNYWVLFYTLWDKEATLLDKNRIEWLYASVRYRVGYRVGYRVDCCLIGLDT